MTEALKRFILRAKIYYYGVMNKRYLCRVSEHQYNINKAAEYKQKGAQIEAEYHKLNEEKKGES